MPLRDIPNHSQLSLFGDLHSHWSVTLPECVCNTENKTKQAIIAWMPLISNIFIVIMVSILHTTTPAVCTIQGKQTIFGWRLVCESGDSFLMSFTRCTLVRTLFSLSYAFVPTVWRSDRKRTHEHARTIFAEGKIAILRPSFFLTKMFPERQYTVKLFGSFSAYPLRTDNGWELARRRKLIYVSEKVYHPFFRKPMLFAEHSSGEVVVKSKVAIRLNLW